MTCKEGPGNETERGDVAERANIKKGAPAQAVNQPETDESENEVSHANADRLQQSSFCAEAGEFKDARSEVQNRVDARKLVEEGNQDGKQDRFLQTPGPEISGRCFLGRCSDDRVRLGCDFGFRSVRFNPLKDLHAGLAIAFLTQQPTWTFGKGKTEHCVEQRRKRGH